MRASSIVVSGVAELIRAAQDPGIGQVVIDGELSEVPALRLSPGQVLLGQGDDAALIFAAISAWSTNWKSRRQSRHSAKVCAVSMSTPAPSTVRHSIASPMPRRAVGIQISRPIGYLGVRRGLETFGGTGDSLVMGVVLRLSAIALSVKPGSSAREIDIEGSVIKHGNGIAPLELLDVLGRLGIEGGVSARQGHRSQRRSILASLLCCGVVDLLRLASTHVRSSRSHL